MTDNPVITERQLIRAGEACRSFARQHHQACLTRNALIVQALREGWSNSRLAETLGLTRGRISQLTTTTEENS